MTSMSKRYENIQSLYLCKHLLTYSEHPKWVRESRSAFMMGRFEANVQGGHTQSRAGGSNGRSPIHVMAVITRSMTREQREEESLSAKFQCVCRSTYKAGTWVFAVFSSILYTHKTKETTRYPPAQMPGGRPI